MKRSKRKSRRAGIRIIAVMVLIICAVVMYNKASLSEEYHQEQKKEQELNLAYEKEELRLKTLEEQKAYMQTKRFAEDVARKVFGLVKPDEKIFDVQE